MDRWRELYQLNLFLTVSGKCPFPVLPSHIGNVMQDEDSSDDENFSYLMASDIVPVIKKAQSSSRRTGARLGKRQNKRRDFTGALRRLQRDYFGPEAKYSEVDFERRFRMPRRVFEKIYSTVRGKSIFVQRSDCTKKEGIHPLLRVTAALRMMAYGVAADALDEYLEMSEDSVLHSLKAFGKVIVAEFGQEYLREPTEEDLKRIMSINVARGFPGCIGSIDCQHWEWKNCPIAWAGQFKGKEKKPTIVLEAICDAELWIWHCFFGSPGSLNDINVLDHSTTIERILAGHFPPHIQYKVNGVERTLPYYLADGIYPAWAIFVKTIQEGSTNKEKEFATAQEAVRKEIERAFGVLVARFHILQRPSRLWHRSDIATVMKACIIIHNMVVEARRDNYNSGMASLTMHDEARAMFGNVSFEWQSRSAMEELGSVITEGMWCAAVNRREMRITSAVDHMSLKHDLIEHIWRRRGDAI